MPILLLIAVGAVAFAFWNYFPGAAKVATYLITFGFILPFMTLAAGTLSYFAVNLFFGQMSYTASLLTFGLPVGVLFTIYIMASD